MTSSTFFNGKWDGNGRTPATTLPCPEWCEALSPDRCPFSPFDGGTGERWHTRTYGTAEVCTATVWQREHALTIDGPSTFTPAEIVVDTRQSGREPISAHQARELSEALTDAADFLTNINREHRNWD